MAITYRWRPGANCGGGYGQVGDLDGDLGAIIGDMWGAGRTDDGGRLWRATNWGAPTVPSGRAIVLSRRPATRGYAFMGVGVSHNSTPGSGYFAVLSPEGKVRVVEKSPYGFGLNIANANAMAPRPAGTTIVTDYDSTSDREYVYSCAPNAITRYVNDSAHDLRSNNLAPVRINTTKQCWKAAVVLDSNRLLLATFTRSSNGTPQVPRVFILSGIRGTNAQLTQVKSGLAVNALRWVGGKLYAACSQGLYVIENPTTLNANSTWTRLGGMFFDRIVMDVCGEGDTLYVGQSDAALKMPTGHAMAKSVDGGKAWKWVATGVKRTLYGSNDEWWLATTYPTGGIGGGGMDVSQLAYGNGRVMAFGRKGAWVSDDGAASWSPAMLGLCGSVVNNLVVKSDGTVNASDVDWDASQSHDKFRTCVKTQPTQYPGAAKSRTVGGHTYKLIVDNTPCDITRDGASIADDTFRGWATPGNVSDLAVAADGTIYVGASGGGVLVGDPS